MSVFDLKYIPKSIIRCQSNTNKDTKDNVFTIFVNAFENRYHCTSSQITILATKVISDNFRANTSISEPMKSKGSTKYEYTNKVVLFPCDVVKDGKYCFISKVEINVSIAKRCAWRRGLVG